MTAEPAAVPQPGHPVPALTTFELRHYRRDLEHALATLPGHAAVRRSAPGQARRGPGRAGIPRQDHRLRAR